MANLGSHAVKHAHSRGVAGVRPMRLYAAQHPLLWIGLAVFALTVLFVDPRRETAINDDWVYALTVQDLLKTGDYQPHGRIVAGMPFQAYWGGLFAHALGYSFTSLRISTLALVWLGLIAFYFLAREHRLDTQHAGLAMLALYASPLVCRLSFSFNTDVPFLMCFIIALFLYTRAIRLESYPLLLLASLAAGAAILTRQVGLALPAGVFALWALSNERKRKAIFYAMGLFLPVLAGGWQLSAAVVTPTWFQQQELQRQAVFLTTIDRVWQSLLWRPTVILQYVALFSLPFMLPAVAAFTRDSKQRRSMQLRVVLPWACALYVVGAVMYGHFAHDRPWLLPYIPWESTLARMSRWQRAGLTLVTLAGGTLYTYILVRRYATPHGWGEIPPSERLLDLCTLFLLVGHLFFRLIGDRYVLGFLPFIFIVVGRYLEGWQNRWKMAMTTGGLAMLVISALWTRGMLAAAEAKWMAAEAIRAAGVEPRHIVGFSEWNLYHGAFDDYMLEVGDFPRGLSTLDFWHRWYPIRQKQAHFRIIASARPPVKGTWDIVGKFPYRDSLFRLQHFYVVQRHSLSP